MAVLSHILPWAFTGVVGNQICADAPIFAWVPFAFIYIVLAVDSIEAMRALADVSYESISTVGLTDFTDASIVAWVWMAWSCLSWVLAICRNLHITSTLGPCEAGATLTCVRLVAQGREAGTPILTWVGLARLLFGCIRDSNAQEYSDGDKKRSHPLSCCGLECQGYPYEKQRQNFLPSRTKATVICVYLLECSSLIL